MTARSDGDGTGYVAVIFSNVHTGARSDEYMTVAARMEELAAEQPGYLGIESARNDDGFGITVSYWRDEAAARAWKQHSEHLVAQATGRSTWYERYRVRVATVTRDYAFPMAPGEGRDAGEPLLHLALPDDWAAARTSGDYRVSTRGRTLEEEGFIHCSNPSQLEGVANRFYADLDELVILHVDPARLDAEIRHEPPADGIDELFPHVYGSIPVAAVFATTRWNRDGGPWRRPAQV